MHPYPFEAILSAAIPARIWYAGPASHTVAGILVSLLHHRYRSDGRPFDLNSRLSTEGTRRWAALEHWGRAVEQLEKHLEMEGTEG